MNKFKGDWEMVITEDQMKVIISNWLKDSMYVHGSAVVSVRQAQRTKKFTIKLEELNNADNAISEVS